MTRKGKLNERQTQLLGGLADSRPVRPQEMTTVYALRNRGLVSVTGRGARATVKVTEAGRYYLKHGSYPAAGQDVEVRAVRPSRTAARIEVEELLRRLRAAGGWLRITDPDRRTRAAWRSVIDRAKKDGLPEGWFLRHHGRDRGDLVIELDEGPHPHSAYLKQGCRGTGTTGSCEDRSAASASLR